jgi:energy-coupling factor transporter ATP-binding protein EcfA2
MNWRDRVTSIVERHAASLHKQECIYLHGPGGEGKSYLANALDKQFPNTFYFCNLDEYNASVLREFVTKRDPRSLMVLLSNFPPESRAGIRRIPPILGPVTVIHADTGTYPDPHTRRIAK